MGGGGGARAKVHSGAGPSCADGCSCRYRFRTTQIRERRRKIAFVSSQCLRCLGRRDVKVGQLVEKIKQSARLRGLVA